jgi:proline iminopeptidase
VFPAIEPFRSGHLEVGNGHLVYWEECGNANGKPVVVLHGGPGSGCTLGSRRSFNPNVYRIVLLDQRNCGRSLPHACEPQVDLSHNTTQHLIGDIELVRESLGIEKWMVRGASWGATLALAYAEEFPNRVTELMLLSATSGRRMETDLLAVGLGRMFRGAWAEMDGFASRAGPEGGVLDRMHRLLFDPDPEVREEAALQWCAWETAILPTASAPSPRFDSAEFRLAFARLVTHYWRHGCWLDEGILLKQAHRISHIPGVIIQGRLDLGNLSGTPWELAARLPKMELVFIEESGHEGSSTFAEVLDEWTQRLSQS